MCTLLFAYKIHPEYDFIFLGNRDEFKSRPSQGAHFWLSNPNVIAGIDKEKGGTWAGITKEGRMAFLTNYRDLSLPKNSTRSRGILPRDFLISAASPVEYLQEIKLEKTEYNPFNLLVGSRKELYYYSNIEDEICLIQPGIYGLSNALLDTPWFKVQKGKKLLLDILQTDFSVNQLFDILDNKEVALEKELPHTGLSIDKERELSSIYVDTKEYGTQFKTVILINRSGEVRFYEKSLNGTSNWNLSEFSFKLDPK